jgi:hypothetical protein
MIIVIRLLYDSLSAAEVHKAKCNGIMIMSGEI